MKERCLFSIIPQTFANQRDKQPESNILHKEWRPGWKIFIYATSQIGHNNKQNNFRAAPKLAFALLGILINSIYYLPTYLPAYFCLLTGQPPSRDYSWYYPPSGPLLWRIWRLDASWCVWMQCKNQPLLTAFSWFGQIWKMRFLAQFLADLPRIKYSSYICIYTIDLGRKRLNNCRPKKSRQFKRQLWLFLFLQPLGAS